MKIAVIAILAVMAVWVITLTATLSLHGKNDPLVSQIATLQN